MVVKITKILTCDAVHSTATKSLNSVQTASIQPYIKHSKTLSMIVTVQTHNMHGRLETWTLETWESKTLNNWKF
jgi:hypothetical protein